MLPKIKPYLLQVCVLALIAILCVDRSRAATEIVEITGIILVVDLFEGYSTAAVLIAGDNGEMYAVSSDEKRIELIRHENKTVKVIGTVAINENGGKTIEVERYEILEEYLKDNLRGESRNGGVSNTTTI